MLQEDNGQLRLADAAADCNASELAISWSQRGPQGLQGPQGMSGADGVSPSVAPLAADDPNCPAGGAAITDAAGSTAYVCSGEDGEDGTDGQPFTGTFTSPNGEYSISVTDAGVTLSHGTQASISLVGDDITARVDGNVEVRTGGNLSFDTTGFTTVQGSGTIDLSATQVKLNAGSGCPNAARRGDYVAVDSTGVGPIIGGSPTVCIG